MMLKSFGVTTNKFKIFSDNNVTHSSITIPLTDETVKNYKICTNQE
jgi:hypothetical protein